jgi:hypothetical protein
MKVSIEAFASRSPRYDITVTSSQARSGPQSWVSVDHFIRKRADDLIHFWSWSLNDKWANAIKDRDCGISWSSAMDSDLRGTHSILRSIEFFIQPS